VKILALIPARGGSKRLPGKNIRLLGGKPLIAWSIDCVKDVPLVCDTLVSTDDPSIAEVAEKFGALVPWLRPDILATDAASSVDVCLHALNWYEEAHGAIDGLLLLQPTSPFRSKGSVSRAIELFCANPGCSVVAVVPATSHPMWCLKIEGSHLSPFVDGGGLHLRSQDLPPAYFVTGGIYLIAPSDLRGKHTFFTPDALPLIVEAPEESIDIDSMWDWRLAEAYLQHPNSVER
jgi:CMP-N,N'-diacetyllegionaminic acid synthase